MENVWQFLRRHQPQDPDLFTIRGNAVVFDNGGVQSDNLITSSQFGYAVQGYRRLTQTFNGYSIWQGIGDTTAFVVAANIPATRLLGAQVQGTNATYQYVAIIPDSGGSENYLGWKMTKAADIPSIQDGLLADDLVRGSYLPLAYTPERRLGFIAGGDCPVPGTFFRTLSWAPGEESVYFDEYLSLTAEDTCIDNGSPDARPVVVASTVDLADLLAQASSQCQDLGQGLEQFVTEFVTIYDPSHPAGPQFLAQGVACCGVAPSSSPTEEGSSPVPETSSPAEEVSSPIEVSSPEAEISSPVAEVSSAAEEISSAAETSAAAESSSSGEVVATGGTITYVDGYKIHTFKSSDTFTVIRGGAVEVLVVAGGGGGAGADGGGGGGAGGLIYDHDYFVSPDAMSVTVGDGGGGTSGNDTPGVSGSDSVFGSLTAVGGGGGGPHAEAGIAGGSGGGAGRDSNYASGGAGTAGQGYAGGITTASAWASGGGGGGASEVGGNGGGDGSNPDDPGGAGGDGLEYSISGEAKYYAGGGGGAALNNTGGVGGLGGGGNGGSSAGGSNGTANTGGGGGGGRGGAGGNGGSGIVIIRYPYTGELPSEPSGGVVCDQTLNNTMLGITSPFCSCYEFGGKLLTYTPSNAGGSGPGPFNEGWTVDGLSWQFGDPEIFHYSGSWYLYNGYDYPYTVTFTNGEDGCGGLTWTDYGDAVTCCS